MSSGKRKHKKYKGGSTREPPGITYDQFSLAFRDHAFQDTEVDLPDGTIDEAFAGSVLPALAPFSFVFGFFLF